MGDAAFWPRFVVAALAVWRLTHLLAHEDGPADVIVRVRARVGDRVGGLMDCFYCLSVWMSAPLALLVCRDPLERLIAWLALSGAACLLERISGDDRNGKAVSHELLRSETGRDANYELTAEGGAAHEGSGTGGWH